MRRKIASFALSDAGADDREVVEPGCALDLSSVGRSMMIAQQRQAMITTIRLTEIVVNNDRNREGAASIQRPREEANMMIARLELIPLVTKLSSQSIRCALCTHIHDAALKPSGNADAVKRTWVL